MNKQEVEIPHIFYLYLHSKIWGMARGHSIRETELKKYLFQWKIPEKIKPLIIKELMILGLLKKEKKYFLKIKRPKFSEESLNFYYHKLGIF